MSNDKRTPLSAEHLKNALAGTQQPYTLENDYEGASAPHVIRGTGKASTVTPTRSGDHSLSYGRGGMRGEGMFDGPKEM